MTCHTASYLYAFPVSRLLHELVAGGIGFYAYVALSTLCSLCLAFVSWHLIEKRALRLKAISLRAASSTSEAMGSRKIETG